MEGVAYDGCYKKAKVLMVGSTWDHENAGYAEPHSFYEYIESLKTVEPRKQEYIPPENP
jgi:hypothetical protein